MTGTIANPSGEISTADNGDIFTGTSSGNLTIDSGVDISTQVLSPWTLAAGATLTLDGNLSLVGTDELGTAPAGDAEIAIGATGTLSLGTGFGTGDAGQIAFGPTGGVLDLQYGVAASLLSEIDNFQPGDNIVLEGIFTDTATLLPGSSGDILQISNNGITVAEIGLPGLDPSVTGFSAYTDADGNGHLTALCFTAGTRILTESGEVAVEDLSPGDRLITAGGIAKPLRWLGRSSHATRFADPLGTLPVRIRAGALADGIPARDLLVSPDHAMFLDGMLVQAAALINGSSITQEARMPERFTYYHVELASHELILAEGAWTESFVDNAGRMSFDNWAEYQAIGGGAPISELDHPRAKSARQVPPGLREALIARAGQHAARAA